VAVTELFSPSSITVGSESFLNFEKQLRSLDMWCDAPDSMTHLGTAAALGARAQAVSEKSSQSPVVAKAVLAVALFTLHHYLIRV